MAICTEGKIGEAELAVAGLLTLEDLCRVLCHMDTPAPVKEAYLLLLVHCYVDTDVEMLRDQQVSTFTVKPLCSEHPKSGPFDGFQVIVTSLQWTSFALFFGCLLLRGFTLLLLNYFSNILNQFLRYLSGGQQNLASFGPHFGRYRKVGDA